MFSNPLSAISSALPSMALAKSVAKHKSEINATMVFTQSLVATRVKYTQ
ncbi:MAG TPA: hypothetical protein VF350_06945 [Candidatus Bathyarchaeia archaeon]